MTDSVLEDNEIYYSNIHLQVEALRCIHMRPYKVILCFLSSSRGQKERKMHYVHTSVNCNVFYYKNWEQYPMRITSSENTDQHRCISPPNFSVFMYPRSHVFALISCFFLWTLFSLWCCHFFSKKKLIPFIRYVKIFHTDLGSITGNLERAVILSSIQLGYEPLNREHCEIMAWADCPFFCCGGNKRKEGQYTKLVQKTKIPAPPNFVCIHGEAQSWSSAIPPNSVATGN